MQPQRVEQKTWSMKDAARKVGVGLPRLYEKLRARGLCVINPSDGRNLPTSRAIDAGYFVTEDTSYYNKQFGCHRPYKKVACTYDGLTLLQEIADELAGTKEQEAG